MIKDKFYCTDSQINYTAGINVGSFITKSFYPK